MVVELLIGLVLVLSPQAAQADPSAPAASSASAVERPRTSAGVFLIEYRKGPRYDAGRRLFDQVGVREHVAHFEALGADLLGAAPVRPRDDGVLGYVLRRAASAAEAEAWLQADPAVAAQTMTGVVREWGVESLSAYTAVRR